MRDPTSIPRLPLLAALPLLAGCHGVLDTRNTPLGVLPCGTVPDAQHVAIDIRYDAAGLPSATPETCEVAPGTEVTWRGPAGRQTAFEIVFKGASPVPAQPRGRLPSRADGDRQATRQRVDGPRGRYEYGIRANGREVDPAIIIR